MPSFTTSAGGYHTTPEEEELLCLAMLVETGLLDNEHTESVEITLQIYGDFTPTEIEELLAIAAAGGKKNVHISIPDASKGNPPRVLAA
jgi:hypothetical protein